MENINYYIKTNRTFSFIRQYAWIITVLVAIGGQFIPKLGLVVLFIMAGLTLTAFFKGRYWCGNFCPHGSLFDRIIMPISNNRNIPKFLKSKPMIIGFFIFFMTNFTRKIFKVSNAWGNYDFYDKLGYLFSNTYLMVLVVGGVLAVFVNSRTWCQFCPMGTIQKISHKFGTLLGVTEKTEVKITIEDKSKCHLCGKCSRVCPFQLTPYLEFSDNNQFNNINCIKCSTCVENCPAGILSLSSSSEAVEINRNSSKVGFEDRKNFKTIIKNIIKLDEETNEYIFSFLPSDDVKFKAGQFILIKIQDEPLAYRAYSISSFDEKNYTIGAIIKRVEKGYGTSIIFDNFKVGDTIELEGPIGDELTLDSNAEKVLFIANGIGITPFIAMSKEVVNKHSNIKNMKLLAGQRYENDLLYNDYFEKLDKENEIFEYIPVLSRDNSSNYKKGYVTDALKEMDLKDYKVYICGSKNMITDSYDILLNQGVKRQDIFFESEEKIKMAN